MRSQSAILWFVSILLRVVAGFFGHCRLNASFFYLFGVKPKVPPRPWFSTLLGARTGNMPGSCTSSIPWAQWPFAPVSALIQISLVFPPSSLIPSSHILISSNSVRTSSRASLSSLLCGSMGFTDLTKKSSTTTILGTRCVFLGARTVDTGHCLPMA